MGHAIPGKIFRWPNRTVPFIINATDFPTGSSQLGVINSAITKWNNTAGIHVTLIPRTAETFFVEFVAADSSCSSDIGKKAFIWPSRSGKTQVRCDTTADFQDGNVIHEIGHAVGLLHEHTRSDRDNFVAVIVQNVLTAKIGNYNRQTGQRIGIYDFGSIMHYPSNGTFCVQWYPSAPVPQEFSRRSPSLATFAPNGELHMVHVGPSSLIPRVPDSTDIWHSWTSNGAVWTRGPRVPGRGSRDTPALASFSVDGQLHMVHRGRSSDFLFHSRSADGRNWNAPVVILNMVEGSGTPALTEFKNELHLVHRGKNSNELFHLFSADGLTWTQNPQGSPIPGQFSRDTPALASFSVDGQLHMVHRGQSDDFLYHSWSADGRTWSDPFGVPIPNQQSSRHAPALAEFVGDDGKMKLHMAYADEAGTVWHTYFGRVSPLIGSTGTRIHIAYSWSPATDRDNNKSRFGPALISFDGRLTMMLVKANSSRIVQTSRDATLQCIVPSGGTTIGQRVALSTDDIATVNTMYP
ncbi:M12 family metallopeptidase [Nocardia sp. CA-119907]|uniref:M12 family metallopeptidase n=1 Tax=Nocardia sp. CA-119907 TaxID=3239973 RepID=UPI003D991201